MSWTHAEDAAEQPDAADEVGALQGRFAPPSQLIRVFDGRRRKDERRAPLRMTNRAALRAIAVFAAGLGTMYAVGAVALLFRDAQPNPLLPRWFTLASLGALALLAFAAAALLWAGERRGAQSGAIFFTLLVVSGSLKWYLEGGPSVLLRVAFLSLNTILALFLWSTTWGEPSAE